MKTNRALNYRSFEWLHWLDVCWSLRYSVQLWSNADMLVSLVYSVVERRSVARSPWPSKSICINEEKRSFGSVDFLPWKLRRHRVCPNHIPVAPSDDWDNGRSHGWLYWRIDSVPNWSCKNEGQLRLADRDLSRKETSFQLGFSFTLTQLAAFSSSDKLPCTNRVYSIQMIDLTVLLSTRLNREISPGEHAKTVLFLLRECHSGRLKKCFYPSI